VFDRIARQKNGLLYKLVLFLNRKALSRARKRYLENTERSSKVFEKYKSYRLLLLGL
jgi:hypothetical protein